MTTLEEEHWRDPFSAAVESLQAPMVLQWVTLHYVAARDMQILLTEQADWLMSDGAAVIVDERTNRLGIRETEEKQGLLMEIIDALDIPLKQVLIEARIVTMSRQWQRELGIQWQLSHAEKPFDFPQQGGLHLSLPMPSIKRSAPNNFVVSRVSPDVLLDLELAALEAEKQAEIIASPHLMTVDKQPAVIETGTEIPYQEAASSGATSISFRKAVLGLRVTPQINADDKILLAIHVNDNSPGELVLTDDGGEMVTINTREINTNVWVSNGETIVLGGIFTKNTAEVVERIPFLGSIPLVGLAFQHTVKKIDQQEVLIFITSTIVK